MKVRAKSLALAASLALALAAAGDAAPVELTWSDLIPASAVLGGKVNTLTGTVQHNQVTADKETPGPVATAPIEEMLGISSGVAFRNDLDGKEVKLSGFILPLAFNGTKVTQLLLVPFVGACIHVPPPPANQLVLVEVPQGYASSGLWEPISVTGTLSVSGVSTELAQVGYALKASAVAPAK